MTIFMKAAQHIRKSDKRELTNNKSDKKLSNLSHKNLNIGYLKWIYLHFTTLL